MLFARLRPTLLRGRSRELKLTGLSGRSRDEVRGSLARSAEQVEDVLKDHARRISGQLPQDWADRVERKQVQGDGQQLPELVSYAYDGVYVLDVWTYVEHDALHILMRRSRTSPTHAIRRSASFSATMPAWSNQG